MVMVYWQALSHARIPAVNRCSWAMQVSAKLITAFRPNPITCSAFDGIGSVL